MAASEKQGVIVDFARCYLQDLILISELVSVIALYLVRVMQPKNDPSNVTLMSAVPLAVIDASICW